MAKGQMRSTKEAKKPKKDKEKKAGPKYMRSADLAAANKSAVTKLADKK
jgi:hypothetical protein